MCVWFICRISSVFVYRSLMRWWVRIYSLSDVVIETKYAERNQKKKEFFLGSKGACTVFSSLTHRLFWCLSIRSVLTSRDEVKGVHALIMFSANLVLWFLPPRLRWDSHLVQNEELTSDCCFEDSSLFVFGLNSWTVKYLSFQPKGTSRNHLCECETFLLNSKCKYCIFF